MNANVGLAVSVCDDLVIEEFGRLSMAQVPSTCFGSHIAPAPLAVVDAA